MILRRLVLDRTSTLYHVIQLTEASFSSVKIYETISKRNFVRLSRGQRIEKPFISAHTCSGLITDTGSSLSPRVSMSQILFYPRFPNRFPIFPTFLHALQVSKPVSNFKQKFSNFNRRRVLNWWNWYILIRFAIITVKLVSSLRRTKKSCVSKLPYRIKVWINQYKCV